MGIVDYGTGNNASIVYCLRDLGYKVRVTDTKQELDVLDVLLLPGVGTFPVAMQALHKKGLVDYLQQQSRLGKPVIGICLGMQLLAEASYEYVCTGGLGLIPGEVIALSYPKSHIGWNTLVCAQKNEAVFKMHDGRVFYFNHSYIYSGDSKYQVCTSYHHKAFASVIGKDNVVGLQFHPEKSQAPGRELLRSLISDMCNA